MSSIRHHWPEYVLEAVALATFMVSAVVFATLFQHPASPLSGSVERLALPRLPMGIAMGVTAVALIYSPIGRRSGAHLNPAVTLAFLRLGRIAAVDAAGYVAAQCAGAIAGLSIAVLCLRGLPADMSVNFVATVPGPSGPAAAFGAEAAMSFAMMLTVLTISGRPTLMRYTGLAAGALVTTYIVIEAPLSGMSLNPARTLASGLFAHTLDSLWIYFTAPPLGMMLAAELCGRTRWGARIRCAKLHHVAGDRCIFKCGHAPAPTETHV
jgi:aquaporin Z